MNKALYAASKISLNRENEIIKLNVNNPVLIENLLDFTKFFLIIYGSLEVSLNTSLLNLTISHLG